MAEWLRRWTANPMGFARVGSNPISVVNFLFAFIIFSSYSFLIPYIGYIKLGVFFYSFYELRNYLIRTVLMLSTYISSQVITYAADFLSLHTILPKSNNIKIILLLTKKKS